MTEAARYYRIAYTARPNRPPDAMTTNWYEVADDPTGPWRDPTPSEFTTIQRGEVTRVPMDPPWAKGSTAEGADLLPTRPKE